MKRFLLTWLLCAVAINCLAQKQEFPIPDKLAEYPGGTEALGVFLQENLQYPSSSRMARVEGRVTISFIVDKEGNITNPTVKDSPDAALSAEALRVIKMMPRWKPAQLAGKPVKMRFTLPVKFSLPATSFGDIDIDAIVNSGVGARENPRGYTSCRRPRSRMDAKTLSLRTRSISIVQRQIPSKLRLSNPIRSTLLSR